ncbi:hypothetical protein Dxin01_01803 [Deinococcus xinjiangensis]|uniref:Uncharacterized protein n=2 Tax=Deinococcus xinjiangensis TaxID=457454 RepID=A0ABP9V9W1_9DEIO
MAMSVHFRATVAQALISEQMLETELGRMDAQDWQPIADLFAAKLPEFDAVIGLPDADLLALAVAKARGVPLYHSASSLGQGGGEVLVMTAQLQGGQPLQTLAEQIQRAGWTLPLVAAAIERTNKGARTLLGEMGITVRAVLQVADTPAGLVFERRTPDRWAS